MQKIEPKEIRLKNGKVVWIRQAEINDAEQLLSCIKEYITQSDYIPKFAEEITLTIEQEKEWIHSFLEHKNCLLLVAEYENQIIGNIDLTGSRRIIMEHTAVIGMGMLPDWRNCGLGTSFLKATIEWARQNPLLEIIWLQVYAENKPGLHLYRKLGFEENGTIKDFFKQNNRYFNIVTMSIKVK